MFNLFRRIATAFLMPFLLSVEVSVLGIMLIWFTRRQRIGKVLVTAGVFLLALMSLPLTADLMLGPLESQYLPVWDPRVLTGDPRPIRWVVVLGGGNINDMSLPVTSRLSSASLVRTVEGVRFQRAIRGSKLLLSGGRLLTPVSEARSMADLAILLGVDAKDIVLEENSLNTLDHARIIRGIVGRDRFVLVTSASHMPRAMGLFEGQGLTPIPVPTDYRVSRGASLSPWGFFLGPGNLIKVQIAFHEWLGLGWAKLRGQLGGKGASSTRAAVRAVLGALGRRPGRGACPS